MLTKIEWVDHSINPIRVKGGKVWRHGYHCTKVSPGCTHCYAESMNVRFGTGQLFDDRKVEFYLDLSEFDKLPKKSCRVFVQSMGDIFHEQVPFEFIYDVWEKTASRPRCTFMVLTKRPERAAEFIKWYKRRRFTGSSSSMIDDIYNIDFKNLWLGVTVESPEYLWRIDELMKIPAAGRFVSFEPLLGSMDSLKQIWVAPENQKISWAIIGAESGPKRRECNIQWVGDLLFQLKAANIPVFIKQLHIDGQLSKNMDEWPEDLRIREFPHD